METEGINDLADVQRRANQTARRASDVLDDVSFVSMDLVNDDTGRRLARGVEKLAEEVRSLGQQMGVVASFLDQAIRGDDEPPVGPPLGR